jgi:hypothetical protein
MSNHLPRLLWSLDGASWVPLESQTGLPEAELRQVFMELGFTRAGTYPPYWSQGPCLDCMTPFPRGELDTDHRCTTCAEIAAAIREEELREICGGTDLEKERRAYLRRVEKRRKRDRGIHSPRDAGLMTTNRERA